MSEDINVLGGVPCNPAAWPRGFTHYHVRPGYRPSPCHGCKELLWVGPIQQKLLKEGWPLLCGPCLHRTYGADAVGEARVIDVSEL